MNISRKKIGVLVAFVALVSTAFTASVMLTTVPVRVLGPFYTTAVAFDSTAGNQVGCQVQYYLSAANDSPRIGQAVYISAINTVKHDTIAANYNKLAGLVVGGTRTSMQASYVVGDTSTLVATTGQRVIVCTHGRAWALVDTAAGASPGNQIMPSNKSGQAGRVMIKPAALDSLNRVFGRAVDSVKSGKVVLLQVNVR